MTPDQLIESLTGTLDDALDEFYKSLDSAQQESFLRVMESVRELELKNGRIRPTLKNILVIRRIKKDLEDAVNNPEYKKAVDKLVEVMDKVSTIQNQYFSAVTTTFSPSKVFEELKQLSIDQTIEGLTSTGISQSIGGKLQDILKVNITSGASFKDLSKQLSDYMTDTKSGDGALKKYATTYSTTAVYQYSRQYNQLATNDLGLVWFIYDGGKQKTSRPFCVNMVKARSGCMRYIHKSQIPELLKGHICSGDVNINDKTGLPDGFIEGTTADNFQVYCGGWNCRHKLVSVPSVIVPKELRAQFE